MRDDEGEVVAIDGAANGYSGDCMWSRALDSTLTRAPLVDGKATFGGVVFGDGRCEGLRFVYENTIDVEAGTSVTSRADSLIAIRQRWDTARQRGDDVSDSVM